MGGFIEHISSSISLTLITSIFTYRLINALLEYVIFPLINILIDPDENICKLNFTFTTGKNNQKKKINSNPDIPTETPSYNILIGAFIKEVIIWLLYISILFIFFNNKLHKISEPKINGIM
jgi:hypothetical protein